MTIPRPQLDPELSLKLADVPLGVELDPEILKEMRRFAVPAETYLAGRAIEREETSIRTADGFDLPLSVFRPTGGTDAKAPSSTGCMAAAWSWATVSQISIFRSTGSTALAP